MAVNGLKKGMDAENRAAVDRVLPKASDEWAVDMPSVDLVVRATRTVRVMVMVSVTHETTSPWAHRPVIRCRFALNFCLATNQAVALMPLMSPTMSNQTIKHFLRLFNVCN